MALPCRARPVVRRRAGPLVFSGGQGVVFSSGQGVSQLAAAAEGRSNREIAGELYVTLKAVEGHLARVYAKLGIGGRGQLADALAAGKDDALAAGKD